MTSAHPARIDANLEALAERDLPEIRQLYRTAYSYGRERPWRPERARAIQTDVSDPTAGVVIEQEHVRRAVQTASNKLDELVLEVEAIAGILRSVMRGRRERSRPEEDDLLAKGELDEAKAYKARRDLEDELAQLNQRRRAIMRQLGRSERASA